MADLAVQPSWETIAGLRPHLATHASIQRQSLRGKPEHVLQNRITGRFYRLSAGAHHLTGLMDGRRTLAELLEAAKAALGDEAPTQPEVVELLGHLYAAEVLQTGQSADGAAVVARRERQRQAQWRARLRNPLAVRIPLFDPDRLLQRLLPAGRVLFSSFGAGLWFAVTLLGMVLAAMHWTEIVADSTARLLSPQNLLLLAFCYPVIKALHELGHALAIKVWGGEVHETGIILMALLPLPYVNASDASAFPEKHRRMLVGAAGIMVEVFLAVLALLLWLNTEPGLVHALAWNTMLIGGASTLLFNGNPLLRFDGYYVLSDAIEIPNLATRSTRYLGYLIQKHLFGVTHLASPAGSAGERRWLATYGILSFVYRGVILIAVLLFVAESYPVIGLLMASWATVSLVLMPVLRHVDFILHAPGLACRRIRAVSVSVAGLLSAGLVIVVVPVPFATVAEGVVMPPEHSELRAGTDGLVTQLLANSDAPVTRHQPLLQTDDPLLRGRLRILEARLKELGARRSALQTGREQLKVEMLDEEIRSLRADVERTRDQVDALLVRSPAPGRFLIAQPDDLPGRFVRQGEHLGYVVDQERPTVRVPIGQTDFGLVRTATRAVSVRLAGDIGTELPASISRQTPAALDRLPSAALGSLGGGRFATDAGDPDGLRTAETVFEVELTVPSEIGRLGERVHVRFDHGSEPLARQWYRRIRQLFLNRFNV